MTAHATHHMAETSLEAFASLDLPKREALVLSVYLLAAAPLTDRDCAKRMGIADMNGCRPRVSGLIAKGLLWECGFVTCEITGRRVRLCTPTSAAKVRWGAAEILRKLDNAGVWGIP